jgi:hypothetical protein
MSINIRMPRGVGVALIASALCLPLGVPAALAAPSVVGVSSQVAAELANATADEKLALDVASKMASLYNIPVFANVAESEARHLAVMRDLLQRHAIADPTAGDAAGAFDDPGRQARYVELVGHAAGSATGAAESGVRLERSIIDNLARLQSMDLPRSADNVTANLLEGARKHLAAYEAELAQQVTAPVTASPNRLMQTAEIRARVSGRVPVGTSVVLTRRPVYTDAGVTVRWRVTATSRETCRIQREAGRVTVTMTAPGTCRVVGFAPAPSPLYNEFRVQRTYRAVP